MIQVLLTDDHQIVRQGLVTLLENQEDIHIADEASNGQEALEKLKKGGIDIILMDINMPIMDGIECCLQVKYKFPQVKVIALSMYKEMSYLERMFQSGAKGYLLKSCSKTELIEAIKSVHANEQYVGMELVDSFESHLKSPNTSSDSNVPRISKREKQILQLISEECTTAQIAGELFLSVTTIETHRKNLLRKLGLKNTAGLMRFAFENSIIS
jgi:DNA-binding NarL/FixJ family response regulator